MSMSLSVAGGRGAFTVIVHTLNEANQMTQCLQSVQGWALDIGLTDISGTDQPRELAANLSTHILDTSFAKTFGITRSISAR